ncbi:hypothetical protein [Iningainema tapete]|uniref:Uncharacterized protein n=1 Tax=Iningainema tapete BLCC-T55 TaxID=2748662 RepID=A0A8J6XNP2_9CYAN|nr:hypothetical protein [Iningainema tapete]MBD2775234.1 hypothetical protein [Iningainema tapete BLCC-T55]
MRFYFYTISGIVSALLGWSLSQILLIDLGTNKTPLNPDFILLPIEAACLAIAMVVTEIFLSNPTRHRANRRVLPRYFWVALWTGIIAGLVASVLTKILYQTGAPAGSVRIVCWSLIGLFTGLGEGVSWRLRSIEGGTRKATKRIQRATLYGLGAGFIAAVLVEILRGFQKLGGYEDALGFLILGLCLGYGLSFATSPTYLVALRAGEGFEAVDPSSEDKNRPRPYLNNPNLQFVTGDDYEFIEEGLSIQLPATTTSIIIGSSLEADIHIPNIPRKAASLTIRDRHVTLTCLTDAAVKIQSRLLFERAKPISLTHNQILTFYHAHDDEKYYRFVFYDRFLDPQA